ncbi:MAG: hypothetical protein H6Q90_2273 [Deltaproteobacteria bacterium]|nr:hypothetical protein [Deltaproteobacteria bacterium]
MRGAAFVIAVGLGIGCRDKALEQLQAIQHEVCACKTPSCGEAALKKVPQQDVKATRDSQAAARKMMECMAKLYLSERPSTDPDSEGSSSSADSGSGSGAATP